MFYVDLVEQNGVGRTRLLTLDLEGKVERTSLSKNKPLFPLFEAVVNSFHSISMAGRGKEGRIEVRVERAPNLFDGELGTVTGFEIEDNGQGFTDANVASFERSESLHKVKLGGKGVGRFVWLKVFRQVSIESNFLDASSWRHRSFNFSVKDGFVEVEPNNAPVSELNKTVIRLEDMRDEWSKAVPSDPDEIARQLVEHCLLMLSAPDAPTVTLFDQGTTISLNDYCREYTEDRATKCEFTLHGQVFRLLGVRIYNFRVGKQKSMFHLVAHRRTVRSLSLEKYLPNLQGEITDESGGKFIYEAFVEGDFLDENVNPERTTFRMPSTEAEVIESGALYPEPSSESIRLEALRLIENDLDSCLREVNEKKQERLGHFVHDHPEYRVLMQWSGDFIDRIPPTVDDKRLDALLNDELHRRRVSIREESYRISTEMREANPQGEQDEAKYSAALDSIMEKLSAIEQAELARYIAHRKIVLDMLQASLERDDSTSKYRLERVLHNLIYPQRSTSETVPADSQNLWILDERLTHHTYLSSDKSIRSIEDHSETHLTRPDIFIFDRTFAFGEGGVTTSYNAFMLVEFKKPGRDQYNNDNPIEQVYSQLRDIRSGSFKTEKGRYIDMNGVPAYAYLICDLTPPILKILEDQDFLRMPDGGGYFKYHSKHNVYFEVLSYEKVVRDAKKRNHALFEKLSLTSFSL